MNKSGKKNVIIICLVAVMICVIVGLAALCYNLYQNSQNTPAQQTSIIPPSGDGIVITEDNKNALSDIKEKVKKGMIEVKMTSNWVFEDGGKSSNAYLANSERNSYDLRFEISIADTGEVIMTSPDVPVGSCIENFPLSVTLESGDYNVVIAHQQIEDGEVMNTVRTAATITVK